jgi:hypothetical protein
MTRFRLSRRQMMAGGLSFTALAAAGGYLTSADAHDFFSAMLQSELPGVKISDATIRAFTADAMKGRHRTFAPKLKVLSMASRTIGYAGVTAMLSRSFAYERFRRELFTQFLLSTDFFTLPNPTARELAYLGPTAGCGSNPFARFEPA